MFARGPLNPMKRSEGQDLVIRADASAHMGTGHVMRCLALAQAWQDAHGAAVLAMAREFPGLDARLKSTGVERVRVSVEPGSADDAAQTAELARQRNAAWVVVDGYDFGAQYQRRIKQFRHSLLVIDDYGHAGSYHADFVLNQNIHADARLYEKREPYTRLLLGTRYVLLRREFLKWRGFKREIPEEARKVLVTLGGGDSDNATVKVVEALQQVEIEGLEAVVVLGGGSRDPAELQALARGSRVPIRLVSNVTNMPDLMAWADVAVSAAGITSWELSFMALPRIVMVLSENQHPIAERLHAAGAAVNLGYHGPLSPDTIARALTALLTAPRVRAEMAQRGRELVDGDGTDRVLAPLLSSRLRLRWVTEDDLRLLWEWANDPEVRAVSFASESIPWEQHVQWFNLKTRDPRCILWIAVNREGIPVGQVRFDIEGAEAVISTSLDRTFRGKGYGSAAIWLASQELFDVGDITAIHAYVKPGNEVSVRAFDKAGYRNVGMTKIREHEAMHLVLRKDDRP